MFTGPFTVRGGQCVGTGKGQPPETTRAQVFCPSVNAPLPGVAAGQYAVDVRSKTGNEWVVENPNVAVKPGDTVHYWYNYIQNGEGHLVKDQTWVSSDPTSAPTTTTTTRRPTTHAQTQAPRVTNPIYSNMQAYYNSLNQTGQGTSGSQSGSVGTGTGTGTSGSQTGTSGTLNTQTGVVSGTSSQTSAASGGSCGCTGKSIRPPGSELTCTTFPCMIFEDNFDSLNLDVWEHEITAGGGGNWEFQYYTNNRTNSYVRDGKLFIKPTLTIESLNDGPDSLTKGALDIWGSQPGDVCTGNNFWGCRQDGTPDHIINPIQSARLRSSRGFNFKYGKVEVRAKMPTGDWIWPAIWMLPLRNAYGRWPASGEIDIVEARGNRNYHDDKGHSQGIDNAGSTLHFGSDYWHNKWEKAHGEKLASSGTYADDFHKYVLIWDEDHISITIDDTEVLNVTPQTNMWEYGGLDKDGVENPWAAGSKMAPLDQEFFLIMNVAVGGVGFFLDKFVNSPGKPWNDKSDFAPRDFWNARGQWYPTWHTDKNNGEDAAMQVDYIRVWKLKP
uniref:Lipopolysaccharide and beta-1,3-glucan-binding protein n=1 Tax=Meretrix meretrix TaxID=291251 RepID=T1SH41_MERMT|nr:lipopolysaccharide and beta-1,3-glucan-binding protein [Meretrix meretrix]